MARSDCGCGRRRQSRIAGSSSKEIRTGGGLRIIQARCIKQQLKRESVRIHPYILSFTIKIRETDIANLPSPETIEAMAEADPPSEARLAEWQAVWEKCTWLEKKFWDMAINVA